jgi:hypothetical protein
MGRPNASAVGLALAAAFALLAAPSRAGDEVEELAVIVNPRNPAKRIDAFELEAIFTMATQGWPGGGTVIPFNYPPEDRLRVAFDRAALRMEPDQVGRFWIDQRVRDALRPPRQVGDPSIALRLVARLPGAIAYVPSSLVDGSVKVVARVRRGKVEEP